MHCFTSTLADSESSPRILRVNGTIVNHQFIPSQHHSVSDAIPKELCSLNYVMTNTAILLLGPGTILVKLDIKNTFSLLPIHPSNQHLLALHWNNCFTCLPFGFHPALKLFNILADIAMDIGLTSSFTGHPLPG